jgi:hypothetical protein
MRFREALIPIACMALAGGCSFVGDYEVHLESGNQPSGFLTRPMTLTASSDASVQDVAQRICSNVRPGSVAQVVFVGKVPGPGPIDLSDWGKYRYDCQAAAVPALVPSAAVAPSAPVAPPAAMPAPTLAAPLPPPVLPLTDAQEQHRRECQRKQGSYQVCVGSCLASSSSSSLVVESECAQRCAAQLPGGCN